MLLSGLDRVGGVPAAQRVLTDCGHGPRVCAQVSPGKYDERGLKSLDFVLETARKYGLQVVLSFIDNWKYYNGVDQYLDWSTTAPNRTMASPFKDLQGDPTGAIYGDGEAGEELKK